MAFYITKVKKQFLSYLAIGLGSDGGWLPFNGKKPFCDEFLNKLNFATYLRLVSNQKDFKTIEDIQKKNFLRIEMRCSKALIIEIQDQPE